MNITATDTPTARDTEERSLTRPTRDRMLTGVAAGIASFLDIDVTIIRVVFAVLAVVGGAGIPIYPAAWLLIPETGAQQSITTEFVRSHRVRAL